MRIGSTPIMRGKFHSPKSTYFPMNQPLEASPTDSSDSPVQRAFRLLRFIAEGGSTGNLSEISRQIRINRITVMRLIESLENAGLIVAGPHGSHTLGMGFLTLAASALGAYDLTASARQVLPGLAHATGLSAYLVVRDGSDIVYLHRETPDTPLISRIKLGSRLAAHTVTPGLVLLSGLDAAALQALYSRDDNNDGHRDRPDDLDALMETLAAIRQNGCAWRYSGLEAGIDSCAAPVVDRRGHIAAAISLAGPSDAFAGDKDRRVAIEQALKDAAGEIARAIP